VTTAIAPVSTQTPLLFLRAATLMQMATLQSPIRGTKRWTRKIRSDGLPLSLVSSAEQAVFEKEDENAEER
jgi:hypothetical protein